MEYFGETVKLTKVLNDARLRVKKNLAAITLNELVSDFPSLKVRVPLTIFPDYHRPACIHYMEIMIIILRSTLDQLENDY